VDKPVDNLCESSMNPRHYSPFVFLGYLLLIIFLYLLSISYNHLLEAAINPSCAATRVKVSAKIPVHKSIILLSERNQPALFMACLYKN
jgi:hypothetical protein